MSKRRGANQVFKSYAPEARGIYLETAVIGDHGRLILQVNADGDFCVSTEIGGGERGEER